MTNENQTDANQPVEIHGVYLDYKARVQCANALPDGEPCGEIIELEFTNEDLNPAGRLIDDHFAECPKCTKAYGVSMVIPVAFLVGESTALVPDEDAIDEAVATQLGTIKTEAEEMAAATFGANTKPIDGAA